MEQVELDSTTEYKNLRSRLKQKVINKQREKLGWWLSNHQKDKKVTDQRNESLKKKNQKEQRYR